MSRTLYAEALNESECSAKPRLADIDSNRLTFAERMIDNLAMSNPEAGDDWVIATAMEAANANLPTALEAARHIAEMRNGPTYCYLAFYGRDGVGQYLKVGMTSHPEKRLYGIATGNPLDCLWVYVAQFDTRKQAYSAEQTILRDIAEHKRRGEWIEITTDAEAARAFARQLAAVIGGEFLPLSYRDGKEAA